MISTVSTVYSLLISSGAGFSNILDMASHRVVDVKSGIGDSS